jgi:hypothetical protein
VGAGRVIRRAAGALTVGLISDTHGLLRPEALAALAGSDHVIHAGDVGAPEILEALAQQPAWRGIRVVVSGHSHVPRVVENDGVLHVNPGSAGPRRFKLPVAVGRLRISASEVRAELVELRI